MTKPKGSKKRNKKATEKENVEAQQEVDEIAGTSNNNNRERTVGQGPMYTILSNAQLNETFHKRYTKELKQLYSKVCPYKCTYVNIVVCYLLFTFSLKLDHDAFMFTFIKMFKTVLEADENNEYGNTALAFCATFVTSFESEKTHPILAETFSWLLSVSAYCTFFSLTLSPSILSCTCLSVILFGFLTDRHIRVVLIYDIEFVSLSI